MCYAELEVRETTPCFMCGPWGDPHERLNQLKDVWAYSLFGTHTIVLCYACVLEEFMVPHGMSECLLLPDDREAIDCLTNANIDVPRTVTKDKFCVQCDKRLALLKTIAARSNNGLT